MEYTVDRSVVNWVKNACVCGIFAFFSMRHYVCTHQDIMFSFFFFNDTATTEIYTLSLHDALPIYLQTIQFFNFSEGNFTTWEWDFGDGTTSTEFDPVHHYENAGVYQVCRSEEHTSELQSH